MVSILALIITIAETEERAFFTKNRRRAGREVGQGYQPGRVLQASNPQSLQHATPNDLGQKTVKHFTKRWLGCGAGRTHVLSRPGG